MLTVEGEHDDISGVGQTRAAHDLLTGIPAEKRAHYMQPKVGHYGVFNGSRFRAEIAPRISDFIATHAQERAGGARTNGHGKGAHVNGATTAEAAVEAGAAAKRRVARKPAKPAH
jgi:poly(3-hydroxybutyrate) depolymerase